MQDRVERGRSGRHSIPARKDIEVWWLPKSLLFCTSWPKAVQPDYADAKRGYN